jgi:hypothetical protein
MTEVDMGFGRAGCRLSGDCFRRHRKTDKNKEKKGITNCKP